MGDSFSELIPEQLEELLHHGRIKATPSKNHRKSVKRELPVANRKDLSAAVTKPKDPDAEWVRLQMEKAEKNIAAPSLDQRRKAERQEASKF
ncbi:MAG: hypothetical protein OK457_03145 [Thaumarchaeota archaeon]|nr:hypothetical protein [Nitrososphaerota archaeon]